jgi:peptidoglycan/xylan/chitin deacetylase (PgdA/CDA1 family)
MTPSLNIGISDVNSFPGSTDYDFSVTSNQIRQGWNFIVVSTVASSHPYGIIKTSGTADFTVSQVKQFRIYLIVPNTKTAIFYFDTAWSNFSQLPAVVIGFDGTGTSDVSNYWTPISREYGYKFYCALSAQSTGGHERVQNYSGYVTGSAAQITAMDEFHAAGNDVINHTLNHTNTSDTSRAQSITDGQLTYQLKAQTAWQLAFGWDRGKELYAAPQGRWDWASMQKMKGWGYTFQRQGSQSVNLHLTPFGYSQNENIGWFSLDAPVSGTACSDNWIAITQTMLGYGADIVWGGHQIIADSGTVTGTTVTGNSLQIYNTSIRTFLTWLKAQEAAGNLVVISMTEMAYGLR